MTGHTRIEAHISTIEPGDRIDHAGMVRCVSSIDQGQYGHYDVRWTDGLGALIRSDAYVSLLVVSNRDVAAFVGGGSA